MASALQKLLRKSLPPTTRFINGFNPSQAPNPIVSLHRECHRPITEPTQSPVIEHFPFASSSCSTVIFPSFPFGFDSKPIFASGFCFPEVEDPGLEDSRTVWADSVKKKRKKKMNKHKYQKLRKRMRRQS